MQIQVPFKQTLIRQIRWMLALPLILQFVVGVPLYCLSVQNEELLKEEKQLMNLISKSGQEVALLNECIACFGWFVLSSRKDRVSSPEVKEKYRIGREDFDKLLLLAQDDAKMLKRLRDFQDKATETLGDMDTLGGIKEPDKYARLEGKLKLMVPLMDVSKDITAIATARMQEQQEQLATSLNKQESARKVYLLLLFLSLGMQILFCLGVAQLFVKRFQARLAVLMDNAYRLPRSLPLEGKVDGSDELNYLDETLHEAEQYLLESAETRSMLMEMIAHDMRSPLMAAQLATELLNRLAGGAPEAVHKNIAAVQRNLDVVINLVNDLLTIDRLESGALELVKSPCEVGSLIEDAMQTVEAIAFTKKIKLDRSCEENLFALADRDRIVQVITNLVTNAIKFSPQGSIIKITAVDMNRSVQICVLDEGPGLPPGSEKKIFEKFQQIKQEHSKRGYGLGLTICKMLVDLHGGTIAAQSLPDKGSKFCFFLPPAKPEKKLSQI